MIRSFRPCVAAAVGVLVLSSPLFAQAGKAAAASTPKAQAPILLTSCGQSPGATSVKVFLQRLQFEYDLREAATVKDLAAKPYKTLIVVTGSSLKGMGAAGVSIDEEIARVTALIAEAKKKGITVIGAHVEGMERRAKSAAPGDNSDEMSIDAVCPKARFLIVRRDGDQDGRFTTLGKRYNLPVVFYEKNLELGAVLKGVFGQ